MNTNRKGDPLDYQCLECGKKMSTRAFVRAMETDKGCPKCGSMDLDLYVPSVDNFANKEANNVTRG